MGVILGRDHIPKEKIWSLLVTSPNPPSVRKRRWTPLYIHSFGLRMLLLLHALIPCVAAYILSLGLRMLHALIPCVAVYILPLFFPISFNILIEIFLNFTHKGQDACGGVWDETRAFATFLGTVRKIRNEISHQRKRSAIQTTPDGRELCCTLRPFPFGVWSGHETRLLRNNWQLRPLNLLLVYRNACRGRCPFWYDYLLRDFTVGVG